ncbi:MAG: hypothetical protein M1820_008794 [Bogoriella megaspora]|nr:MAG: hypothetical protein M1820_008794 [Bogoriella megaspora]
MGSSASKASRSAAGVATRKYPSRPSQASINPGSTTSNRPPPAPEGLAGPTVRPQPRASETRDETINLDSADPAFAQSLRSIGPVQPNPQLSNSSTFPASSTNTTTGQQTQPHFPTEQQLASNPALTLLNRRRELQEQAEEEFRSHGKRGQGRQFLDAITIGRILKMRDEGIRFEEIERRMELRQGVVQRLGRKGVVECI